MQPKDWIATSINDKTTYLKELVQEKPKRYFESNFMDLKYVTQSEVSFFYTSIEVFKYPQKMFKNDINFRRLIRINYRARMKPSFSCPVH
jgi:hypothetical protein